MKTILYILLITAFVAPSVQGRGWRGIVPLKSSRADVERLLGAPTQEINKYTVSYRTSTETATITYTAGLQCGIGAKYSQWKVPRDRVESITVTLIPPISLLKLRIDESKYKKFSDLHLPQDVYYISESEGETIRVNAGEIQDINYTAALSDKALACFPPPPSLDCNAMSPPHFDFYGKIDLDQEKLRLDNFSIALMDEPNRTGYIIAYAGITARPGEAKLRAESAKTYLVTVRHFSANELIAIDGGYREEPEVDLYIVPKGVCPPVPMPTIDPRDVKMMGTRHKTGFKRRNKSAGGLV